MTPLHWQASPDPAPPRAHSRPSSFDNPLVVSLSNPWFTVAVGLMGVIIGFGIGKWRTGDFPVIAAKTPPAQIAAVPTPTVQAPQAPSQPQTAPNLPAVDPQKDHIRGDIAKATVAVVEYSDFECPFCKRVHPTYQQIMQTYGDKVVWVYRHYPLSFHANAQKEAEASDCAADLGGNDAFWQYTDKIFERTTSGGTGIALDQLVPLAKELDLDEVAFKSCLDSGKYAKHVQEDMAGGSTAGVSGTPGNIIYNLKTKQSQIVSGAQPFASFQSAIDAAL